MNSTEPAKKTLLELSRYLDSLKELEQRLALDQQFRTLLGTEYEEFDRRFEVLVTAQPNHASPAETVSTELVIEAATLVSSCFRVHGAGDISLEKPGLEASKAIGWLKLLLTGPAAP